VKDAGISVAAATEEPYVVSCLAWGRASRVWRGGPDCFPDYLYPPYGCVPQHVIAQEIVHTDTLSVASNPCNAIRNALKVGADIT